MPSPSDPNQSDPRLELSLAELPAHRRNAVRTFVTEAVETCPYCGAEVRRNSPRGLDADERLGCLACVNAIVGRCALCRGDVTRNHKRHEFPNGGIAHRACAEKRGR